MKLNLLHAMLINENALRDATKAEMLELQTLLIDQVEEDDLDFDIRVQGAYGFAIHLTHKNQECDVVIVKRASAANVSLKQAYGVKVKGKSLKMSFELQTLISDIHDWLNGWVDMW
jgi:hypothetical protein